MKTVKRILMDEFVVGKTWFDWAFLGVGLILQFIAIAMGFAAGTPDSPGLIISGIAGVISVVLCSQGKISFYLFGFVQLFTYVACFSIPNRLHGETVENVMYFVTMLYGMYAWKKRYGANHERSDSLEIRARKLGVKGNLILFAGFCAGVWLYYLILANVPMFGSLDSDPFVDSLTSVPAYIGQILMVVGFREQWLYWFILDVSSIFLAARAGSWVMTAQFVFWSINCVYGYVNWTRMAKLKDEGYKNVYTGPIYVGLGDQVE